MQLKKLKAVKRSNLNLRSLLHTRRDTDNSTSWGWIILNDYPTGSLSKDPMAPLSVYKNQHTWQNLVIMRIVSDWEAFLPIRTESIQQNETGKYAKGVSSWDVVVSILFTHSTNDIWTVLSCQDGWGRRTRNFQGKYAGNYRNGCEEINQELYSFEHWTPSGKKDVCSAEIFFFRFGGKCEARNLGI
jgi:hypothetical protein